MSERNGKLNWDVLKGQIEAAIIRCGYGRDGITRQDDKQWIRNVTECERLKIPIGVYLYSYANGEEDARSEASHVARLIKGHQLQLPVFYDVEEWSRGNAARKNYYAFESALKSMASVQIGVYSGEAYYNNFLQGLAADWRWIAKYGPDDGKAHIKPVLGDKKSVHIWQYTSKGIAGHMDCSQVLDVAVLGQNQPVAPAQNEVKTVNTYMVGEYKLHDIKYAPRTYDESAKFLQQLLQASGYYDGTIDGLCGKQTLQAIAACQVDLRSTTCGKATWQALISAHSKS